MNGWPTFCITKRGSLTPDKIVVRLGAEYGSVEPSDFLISVSEVSAFFLLVICVTTISLI